MRVTSSGMPEAQERLAAIVARLRDMRPILEVVAQDVRTAIDDSFAAERAPDGTPWAPLSAATKKINPRREGGRVLTDTARLRNSVTTVASAKSLRFGTNVLYGAAHQTGAQIKVFGRGTSRALRARPFLPVSGTAGRFILTTSGPAGTMWARVRSDIEHWVATGEVR
ncbi:MAG: phage virion morphogenesis protein [Acidobacteriota bacterium]|nr:phage virion morphogenesis protein [Acidobacteriota bacterium]